MMGPYFREKIGRGEVQYYRGEEPADLEALYSIILEERGALERPTEADEEISLGVLCGISWPGKPPAYRAQAQAFRREFRGVANDSALQARFRTTIGRSIRQARRRDDLSFDSLSRNFEIPGSESATQTMTY